MRIVCPSCKSTVNATEKFFGKIVPCPRCREMLAIPLGEKPPPLPPAATQPMFVSESAPIRNSLDPQSPEGFMQRIALACGDDDHTDGIQFTFRYDNVIEARALIKQMSLVKKQLNLIKSEMTAVIKTISAHKTKTVQSVSYDTATGLMGLFFGRRTIGRVNHSRRQSTHKQYNSVIDSYKEVRSVIDKIKLLLDQRKADAEMYIIRNK
jgi:hypothetical protein